MSIQQEIRELARERKAIILAHNYQPGEIQDIADITGDSLELARKASGTDAAMIVFCGVHFMAESATILSPQKTVLLPEPGAGCPMADMVDVEGLLALKSQHPGVPVVTYINSSAAVKAHSDVVCTSANAQQIVDRVEGDAVIFVPDRNLASWVQRHTKKTVIPWKGFCPTHERFSADDLHAVQALHPDALVMVHPECRPEVVDLADEVLSTGGMVRFVAQTDRKKIIVGTERDMIHKLRSVAPGIEYVLAGDSFVCPNMKKITLEKVRRSLVEGTHVITVSDEVRAGARRALDRMLALSS